VRAHRLQLAQRHAVDRVKLARDAEAAELDIPVLVHHDVARLQVAVYDAARVQELQRGEQVAAKVVDGRFREALVGGEQRLEVAADAVLEDEPQVVVRLVPAVRKAARSGVSGRMVMQGWRIVRCVRAAGEILCAMAQAQTCARAALELRTVCLTCEVYASVNLNALVVLSVQACA
jgi:hypothetical protein